MRVKQKLSKMLFAVGSLCSIVMPAFGATALPKQARVPGGVAILELDAACEQPPQVHFMGNRTLVLANPRKPQHWLTVVGLPLDVNIGNNQIEIDYGNTTAVQTFAVKPKKYPVERLTISDKRKVEPLPEDMPLIEAEYLATMQTYAHWEYQELKSLRLAVPARGRKSSPFGLTRIMNNVPKNPHSGLDIAAATGTKVFCAKDGVVINIGNYFYSGNIVFVDHGQGFITSYCHLNSVNVTKGQTIKQGQVIGTIGKTGRATGPHLHWSVSLNGVRVDPQLFIAGN